MRRKTQFKIDSLNREKVTSVVRCVRIRKRYKWVLLIARTLFKKYEDKGDNMCSFFILLLCNVPYRPTVCV